MVFTFYLKSIYFICVNILFTKASFKSVRVHLKCSFSPQDYPQVSYLTQFVRYGYRVRAVAAHRLPSDASGPKSGRCRTFASFSGDALVLLWYILFVYSGVVWCFSQVGEFLRYGIIYHGWQKLFKLISVFEQDFQQQYLYFQQYLYVQVRTGKFKVRYLRNNWCKSLTYFRPLSQAYRPKSDKQRLYIGNVVIQL